MDEGKADRGFGNGLLGLFLEGSRMAVWRQDTERKDSDYEKCY